ncbi:inositol monophosphatase family protein [Enterococcus alishanensis]|uniref:Inositol monophosphatase family protein n=1 Tax=Enterococcus alishanensis TaxID=1303817 RepID=A0ABS6TBK0_9ENTE|nr:inositol monophosphatase family protein [Enterococcus alishanensis]MBV7390282.1 inositol monophosphatase family protein [Enterococcus alishanensis]
MENEIIQWIYQAAEKIKAALNDELVIDEKNGRTDLVTNVDKETQDFLVDKIRTYDPDAHILGEENGQDQTDISNGRVFVIDPIDGTMNFVLQKENFCIMIAVFEEGIGQLGFIYDVMRDDLFWGGPKLGKVFHNRKELPKPANTKLADGLIGMGVSLVTGENKFHTKEIGREAMGVRILGCAGLDFIAILKGTQNGYISRLSPWDYAAGIVMMQQFDMAFSGFQDQPLSFNGREFFKGGTQAVMSEITEYDI